MYKKLTSSNCTDFKNFNYGEFKCKCGGKYCNGYPVSFSYDLASNLQKIRNHFGKPLVITSAIRCEKHNKNSEGVSTSKHLKGWAVDFYVRGVTAFSLMSYVKKLPFFRYTYHISGNTIHYDIIPPTLKTYAGNFPILPSRGYFKKNDRGTQVKHLQNFLNWSNGCKLFADGIAGNKTIEQVKIFQKKVGLYADGLFGKDSLNKAKSFKK